MTTTIEDDLLIMEVRQWQRLRDIKRTQVREQHQSAARLEEVRISWILRALFPAAAYLPGFAASLMLAGRKGAAVWSMILVYGGLGWLILCAAKAAAASSRKSSAQRRVLAGVALWLLMVAANYVLMIPMSIFLFILLFVTRGCC